MWPRPGQLAWGWWHTHLASMLMLAVSWKLRWGWGWSQGSSPHGRTHGHLSFPSMASGLQVQASQEIQAEALCPFMN